MLFCPEFDRLSLNTFSVSKLSTNGNGNYGISLIPLLSISVIDFPLLLNIILNLPEKNKTSESILYCGNAFLMNSTFSIISCFVVIFSFFKRRLMAPQRCSIGLRSGLLGGYYFMQDLIGKIGSLRKLFIYLFITPNICVSSG